ncbi:transcription initiation factor IIA gamma subunit [Zalerion maritima]|uniref:Transcription initiation factor IIA subunit 2 n=1 Tax=Zalerion maritima TaxID=339359 RepID=A0AAD5WUS0_9PEZI|nr:transcription initiation factor IIA gamma subunit [Zalerion maritima]
MAANQAPKEAYYELYRRSSLGMTLTDTLDDLISDHTIDPQLAMKVLANFDRAVAEILGEKVKSRLNFKGALDTYRFCDEVWTFLIKHVNLKMADGPGSNTSCDKIKIEKHGWLPDALSIPGSSHTVSWSRTGHVRIEVIATGSLQQKGVFGVRDGPMMAEWSRFSGSSWGIIDLIYSEHYLIPPLRFSFIKDFGAIFFNFSNLTFEALMKQEDIYSRGTPDVA